MKTVSNLFVYGTLMDPRIVRKVAGKVFAMRQAILRGYRKIDHPRIPYPSIRPDPDSSVSGMIILGLTPAALERIDAYETNEYVRERVTAELTSQQKVDVDVYRHREE